MPITNAAIQPVNILVGSGLLFGEIAQALATPWVVNPHKKAPLSRGLAFNSK
jgi:hypothetical protein